MAIEITWTKQAWHDLEQVVDYISQDSKLKAAEVTQEIFDSVERLSDFPRQGRYVPELTDSPYREILVFNYRIIYRVSNSQVYLIAIVHTARNFEQYWKDK